MNATSVEASPATRRQLHSPRPRLSVLAGQVADVDLVVWVEDYEAFNQICQLANIAWPAVARQRLHGGIGEQNRPALLILHASSEVVDEQRQVIHTVAQMGAIRPGTRSAGNAGPCEIDLPRYPPPGRHWLPR